MYLPESNTHPQEGAERESMTAKKRGRKAIPDPCNVCGFAEKTHSILNTSACGLYRPKPKKRPAGVRAWGVKQDGQLLLNVWATKKWAHDVKMCATGTTKVVRVEIREVRNGAK